MLFWLLELLSVATHPLTGIMSKAPISVMEAMHCAKAKVPAMIIPVHTPPTRFSTVQQGKLLAVR